MSLESEPKAPSSWTRLTEMLEKKRASETANVPVETKFGTVDIQPMGDIDMYRPARGEGAAMELEYIQVQVQSPEPANIWTVFKVFSDGRVETEVSEGAFGSPQKVEPTFTLENILEELK